MGGGVSPSSWRTVSAPPPASVNTRKRSCGGHACCRFSRACGGAHHEQHSTDQGPLGSSGRGPGRAPPGRAAPARAARRSRGCRPGRRRRGRGASRRAAPRRWPHGVRPPAARGGRRMGRPSAPPVAILPRERRRWPLAVELTADRRGAVGEHVDGDAGCRRRGARRRATPRRRAHGVRAARARCRRVMGRAAAAVGTLLPGERRRRALAVELGADGQAAGQAYPTPTPTPAPPAAGTCVLADSVERVVAATFQVQTASGSGTAFYIGNGEWITNHHVVDDVERHARQRFDARRGDRRGKPSGLRPRAIARSPAGLGPDASVRA